MRAIAILEWGPPGLRGVHPHQKLKVRTDWLDHGPVLPPFLFIRGEETKPENLVKVRFAFSAYDTLDYAIRNLRKAFGHCYPEAIGYVSTLANRHRCRIEHLPLMEKLRRWAMLAHIDAILWIDYDNYRRNKVPPGPPPLHASVPYGPNILDVIVEGGAKPSKASDRADKPKQKDPRDQREHDQDKKRMSDLDIEFVSAGILPSLRGENHPRRVSHTVAESSQPRLGSVMSEQPPVVSATPTLPPVAQAKADTPPSHLTDTERAQTSRRPSRTAAEVTRRGSSGPEGEVMSPKDSGGARKKAKLKEDGEAAGEDEKAAKGSTLVSKILARAAEMDDELQLEVIRPFGCIYPRSYTPGPGRYSLIARSQFGKPPPFNDPYASPPPRWSRKGPMFKGKPLHTFDQLAKRAKEVPASWDYFDHTHELAYKSFGGSIPPSPSMSTSRYVSTLEPSTTLRSSAQDASTIGGPSLTEPEGSMSTPKQHRVPPLKLGGHSFAVEKKMKLPTERGVKVLSAALAAKENLLVHGSGKLYWHLLTERSNPKRNSPRFSAPKSPRF
ncbi:unnamed protein product [Vitrella brassicaformis CCMP3155]|uniref:Uncharacterized protein n=2 Tax=Vitrella brassicaformis TaxID=1169539 RepID=A0A0G4F3M4_VITBC|nr:unnamed protein product [Vitrella brassicaformis CCMP3155]|eukprot:CEM06812.1 unnamed protein product [Vitrella brassicaformis CCMP3155]